MGEAQAMFDSLDRNQDGKLSRAELSMGLADFGYDSTELDALMYRLDEDKDGSISRAEFVKAYLAMQEWPEEEDSDSMDDFVCRMLGVVNGRTEFGARGTLHWENGL